MGVRKLKAITPGQRFRVVNDYDGITATSPEKSLTKPKRRSGGRNNTGKMTMRSLVVGLKSVIVLSTSSAKSLVSRHLLSQ